MNTLGFYKTHDDVQLPKLATEQAACFDLSFSSAGKFIYNGYTTMNKRFERFLKDGSLYIGPNERVMVPTGLILDIPEGYSVRVHPRSGLSLKSGIVLANSEGVIDSDYVEELFVLIHNQSSVGMTINNGDRIAQAELVKSEVYEITEIKNKPEAKTSRQGGMGSTGVEQAVSAPVVVAEMVVKRGRGRPRKDAA